MANYIDQISSLENLMLAWRKLERAFNHGDVWYDELVISAFRMNLVNNLKIISIQLCEGTYQMKPIQPIPFPKGGKDKDNQFKVRQSFFVDFRDQLVWVAVCNVIGRTFDIMMPAWSYGNRQYVSMWKEVQDNEQHWVVGNHRNTTRQVYRKWTQSWPLMRKRITASLKKMARLCKEDKDETDLQVEADEVHLNENQEFFKLKYLEDDYFPKLDDEKTIDVLYWTGIDLTQFYQKVKMEAVLKKLVSVLSTKPEFDEKFATLLQTLCHFEIDFSDYEYEGAEEDLQSMQLDRDVPFDGLPTGLIVAGMLANIFMIDIDAEVSKRLAENKDIIHFRYVDDHVVISTSPEKLFEWIAWYQKLLSSQGLDLNVSKLAPKELLEGLTDECSDNLENLIIEEHQKEFVKNIREYADIDPKYPTPLMTQTLQKVSMLQGLNLNLLSTREYGMVFGELQSLLVADLSEQEIKESTRISFACTMLTRLIVDGDVDYEKIYYFKRQWLAQLDGLKKRLLADITNKKSHKQYNSVKKVNQLLADCTEIIFQEDGNFDINTIRKKYPGINFDFYCLEGIQKAIDDGRRVTRGKERQVFNMLMHALEKVPDKVRIWIRAFDYCVRHEPSQIGKLFKKLEDYRDTKLHSLSVDYLEALLNTLCAENIIKATARLALDEHKTPIEIYKDRLFLESVMSIEHKVDSSHFFVNDSLYLLSKSFAFYDMYAKKIGMKEKGNEESFFSPFENYHGFNLDETFWLLWANDLLKIRSQKDRPIISKLLVDSLREIKLESNYFDAFFRAYLREVSISNGKVMHLPEPGEATVYTLDKSTKYTIAHHSEITGLQSLLSDDDRKVYCAPAQDDNINLRQWIDYVNGTTREDKKHYELMQSEILSVLIMLSIIKAIEDQGENKDQVLIHPENFYIIGNVLKNGWSYFIDIIDKGGTLEVNYVPNPNVDTEAYRYPRILNSQNTINNSLSYGLGIIFLQLLSKRKVLPWALYSEQVGFEWEYVLHELQEEGKISSMNYRIVSSCLSPRQRENIVLAVAEDNAYVRETFRDNPEIHNWMQLKDELVKSLDHLRRNLISVADEAHRQLTIIDLE